MKKTMLKKSLAILLTAVLFCGIFSFGASAKSQATLSFGADGKFTILQISDPQDDQYPAHELNGFIRRAIETADPDFIVFTGDIVEDTRAGDWGTDDENLREGVVVKDDYAQTLQNVEAACAAVFAPVEAAGIPFGVTLGNNDYKSGISNEDWLKVFAQYPHCVNTDMSDDEDGKLDCFVSIASGSGEPAFLLWLLDNGRSFTQGQLGWFKAVNTPAVPSIVFEHIPVDDIGNLFEECTIFDEGAMAGSSRLYRLNQSRAMGKASMVYTPGASTEAFAAWKSKGVVGAFFGHLHIDGYTGTWDGITLGLTYGCQFAKSAPYGMRTITLDEDTPETFETQLWVYENGAFKKQVDEPYRVYSSKLELFFGSLFNLFSFVRKALTDAITAI